MASDRSGSKVYKPTERDLLESMLSLTDEALDEVRGVEGDLEMVYGFAQDLLKRIQD